MTSILVENHSDHIKLTLNRPDKRNALNELLIAELTEFFSIDHKLPVILTGAGSAFCAGADLSELERMKKQSPEENLKDSMRLKDMFYNIFSYPRLTVAAVNGPALAGGCGLATICDYVIAEKNAKFGYPEVKIGFVAALVSVFLIKQFGMKLAADILYSGEIFTAQQANSFGLVDQVADDDVLTAAQEKLSAFKKVSPDALRLTKKLLKSDLQPDMNQLLDLAAQANAEARKSPDFIEGISAFLQKRRPYWG